MHVLESSCAVATMTRNRDREDQQCERKCHCTKWFYLGGSLKDLVGYVRLLQYGAQSETSNTCSSYKNLWPPGLSGVVVCGSEGRVDVHRVLWLGDGRGWNESRGMDGEMRKTRMRK